MRVEGLVLLMSLVLPWVILSIVVTLWIKTASDDGNQKIVNEFNWVVKKAKTNYDRIEASFQDLENNANKTIGQLEEVKDALMELVNEKSTIAKEFYGEIEKALKDLGKGPAEIKRILLSVKEEISRIVSTYITNLKSQIFQIKDYVSALISYKDALFGFIEDIKDQLEPLNKMFKALQKIPIVGKLMTFSIDLPDIPKFPAFPKIDWQALKPDFPQILDALKLEELKKVIGDQVKGVKAKLSEFSDDLTELMEMPDIDVEFLSLNSLGQNFWDPVVDMVGVAQESIHELQGAKIRINRELLKRKKDLIPWISVFVWAILIWFGIAFINYLFNMKRKFHLAMALLQGKRTNLNQAKNENQSKDVG